MTASRRDSLITGATLTGASVAGAWWLYSSMHAVVAHPLRAERVDDAPTPVWETHFVEPFAAFGLPTRPCLGDYDLELPALGWLPVVSEAAAAPQGPVVETPETLYAGEGAGFAWIALDDDRASIQYLDENGAVLANFRVDRGVHA